MDPFDAEKEAAALDRRLGVIAENLAAKLAEWREMNYALRANPDVPASITVEIPATLVLEGGDVAELQICEVDSWIVVEVGAGPNGSDAIVNAEVVCVSDDESSCAMSTVSGSIEGGNEIAVVGRSGRSARRVADHASSRCLACVRHRCSQAGGQTNAIHRRLHLHHRRRHGHGRVCRAGADAGSSAERGDGASAAVRWVAATAADGWDPAGYGDITPSGYVFGATADGGVVRIFPDGRTEQVFARECPNGVGGFTWVDTSITAQDVIDDAVDRARRAVPAPTLDLSPSPEAGGIVNLGLWLALAGQDPVTVRAEAGSLWAEATVTLASTSWDMGNGDVVDL